MSNNPRRSVLVQMDSEGGVIIPEEWLKDLGWQEGDELAFRSLGSSIYITKVPAASSSDEE